MKIAVACNGLQASGGMERYTLDLIGELLKRGHEICVYTKKLDSSLEILKYIKVKVNKCVLVPHKLRDFFFSNYLKREFAKEHYDLTLGCCRNDACDVVLCGGTHKGFVRAVKGQAEFFDKLWFKLEEREFLNAKICVAHSQLIASEIENLYGINKDKIKIIYPPTSNEKFSEGSEEDKIRFRKQFKLPEDKILFLFPSSSHYRKGYPLLEQVFSQLKANCQLVVAGRPLDKSSDNVIYAGYIKNIENLYKACDYAILASLYEPFGLVGIESTLCGRACVLAENIGCCEVLAAPALQKFKANDAADLKALIERLVLNPVHLQKPYTQYLLKDLSVSAHVDVLLQNLSAAS